MRCQSLCNVFKLTSHIHVIHVVYEASSIQSCTCSHQFILKGLAHAVWLGECMFWGVVDVLGG